MDAIPLSILHSNGRISPTRIETILGTNLELEVTFLNSDEEAFELASSTTGRLVCKVANDLNGDTILLDAVWAHTEGETTYTFSTVADSEQLRDLIDAIDGDDTDLELIAQIEWTLAAETYPRKCKPFLIRVINSPARSTDEAPDVAGSTALAWLALHAVSYYPSITTLIGGTSTALDGIVTTALAARTLVHIVINDGTYDQLQCWMLYAASTAEDTASGIVRPDDYNASTNIKVWKRIA